MEHVLFGRKQRTPSMLKFEAITLSDCVFDCMFAFEGPSNSLLPPRERLKHNEQLWIYPKPCRSPA